MLRSAGFSLVELLTVLAIVALLAAILVPVTGSVRAAAHRAATRARFAQWIAAIEAFRGEYGFYPAFPGNKINGGAGAMGAPAGDDFRFREILSGIGAGGSGGSAPMFLSAEANLSAGTPRAQNRRRCAFHSFGAAELDAGNGAVIDGFGNRDLTVLCDHDGDGLIPRAEILAAGAQVQPPGGDAASPPEDAVPAEGVRAPVVFFSAGDGWSGAAVARERIVLSWR